LNYSMCASVSFSEKHTPTKKAKSRLSSESLTEIRGGTPLRAFTANGYLGFPQWPFKHI
jgi:hypothetical protein